MQKVNKELIKAATYMDESLMNLTVSAIFQFANDMQAIQQNELPWAYQNNKLEFDDWRTDFYQRVRTCIPAIVMFRNIAEKIMTIYPNLPENEKADFINHDTFLLFEKAASSVDEIVIPFIMENKEQIGMEVTETILTSKYIN